jgi:hypothetical protein
MISIRYAALPSRVFPYVLALKVILNELITLLISTIETDELITDKNSRRV